MSDWVQIFVPIVSAVLVAWIGFRFVIRQDERRWSREQRSQLYIDLLAEASAVLDDLTYRLTEFELGEPIPNPHTADLMDSKARRNLGGRMAAYASREVLRRWRQFEGLGSQSLLHHRNAAAYKPAVGMAFDELAAQVRHELETERLPWWERFGRQQNADSSKYLESIKGGPLYTGRWPSDRELPVSTPQPAHVDEPIGRDEIPDNKPNDPRPGGNVQ